MPGTQNVALAVDEQLSGALHRGESALEEFHLVSGDIEQSHQVRCSDRRALFFQDIEDELPARQGVTVLRLLALEVRVTVA